MSLRMAKTNFKKYIKLKNNIESKIADPYSIPMDKIFLEDIDKELKTVYRNSAP